MSQIASACTYHCGGNYHYFPLLSSNIISPGWTGVYEKIAQTDSSRLKELTFVHGHFPFGVHEYFPGSNTYITFLRDPIAREMSAYNFNYQTGYIEKNESINSLIESRKLIDNPQTRLLAGREAMHGECTSKTFSLAAQNLLDRFSLVGIAEDMDFAVRVLIGQQRWPSVAYYRKNVTRLKLLDQLSDSQRRTLESYHKYDLALYDQVSSNWNNFKGSCESIDADGNLDNEYLWIPPERDKARNARMIDREQIGLRSVLDLKRLFS